jgi:hypothetical protein
MANYLLGRKSSVQPNNSGTTAHALKPILQNPHREGQAVK